MREVKNEELALGKPIRAFIGFGRGIIDRCNKWVKNVLVKGRTMQRGEIGAGGTWRGIIRLGKLRCI